MIEGIPIKLIESARSGCHDGCSSRGIVEKGKFTEGLTLLVSPELSWGIIVRAQ